MKNKSYIVENLEFDTKFKTDSEIEELDFKRNSAYGVWSSEGRTDKTPVHPAQVRGTTKGSTTLCAFSLLEILIKNGPAHLQGWPILF